MSEPTKQQQAAADDQSETEQKDPIQYAPVPMLLPLTFVLVFGLIIAYGVLSK